MQVGGCEEVLEARKIEGRRNGEDVEGMGRQRNIVGRNICRLA